VTRVRSMASAGILAAGEGSRLRRDGWRVSKPLVPIGGVPLVQQAIENLQAAGLRRIAILFNEDEADCVRFVQSRFPAERSGVEVRVKTTASSLETFQELSAALPEGRALFQTVDAWCRPEEFCRFALEADEIPVETTVLAVTTLVDDERPLWTRCESGAQGGAVLEIGGPTGDCATAGIYVFSERARRLAAKSRADRLRTFLGELLVAGEPVRAVAVADVVDVDRERDVRTAEALASTKGKPA
jgi:NDP-sugar pyrophosphorylase family protein